MAIFAGQVVIMVRLWKSHHEWQPGRERREFRSFPSLLTEGLENSSRKRAWLSLGQHSVVSCQSIRYRTSQYLVEESSTNRSSGYGIDAIAAAFFCSLRSSARQICMKTHVFGLSSTNERSLVAPSSPRRRTTFCTLSCADAIEHWRYIYREEGCR